MHRAECLQEVKCGLCFFSLRSILFEYFLLVFFFFSL